MSSTLVKVHLVSSQSDIDDILAIDPEHWIGEAVENGYTAEDMNGHAVVMFEQMEPDTIDLEELNNHEQVKSVSTSYLPQYCGGDFHPEQAEVLVLHYESDDDLHTGWVHCTDALQNEGLV